MEVTNEDIKKRFGEFKKIYEDKREFKSFSCIVSGLFGVGKTRLIATGRKPILIDSFDSNGTIILEREFPEMIKNGDLIIRTFWDDNSHSPKAHSEWEKIHMEDLKMGLYNHIGTYAIDSLTTFLDAISNRVSVVQRRDRKKQKLAISDYPIVFDYVKDVVKEMSAFDCDFIMTAHLDRYQDEASGRMVTDIRAYKSLQTELPLLFTEKYVLIKEESARGSKYKLLTDAAGTYRASTQLGAGGKLNAEEEPNLKNIIRKVGLNDKDKPSLF